jgi:hypothetical protein
MGEERRFAVFLFLRADPENWPLIRSFWPETSQLQTFFSIVFVSLTSLFYSVECANRPYIRPRIPVCGGRCAPLTFTFPSNIKEDLLVSRHV